MGKARRERLASWLCLIFALALGMANASGGLTLYTAVNSSVGTDLPANPRDVRSGLQRMESAEPLSNARIHTIPGLAAAWLRGLDPSDHNVEAVSEISVSSQSQLLISELLLSQRYSRIELGSLLSREVLSRVLEQCPAPPASLARICDDEWLGESMQALTATLYELTSTAVGFAAEVRLGDSDLGLEAANSLCGVLADDTAGFDEAYARVQLSEAGTRSHSLGVMAMSCAFPERSVPYLLEIVDSRESGDAMVVAALELARIGSHGDEDLSGLSAHISSALEWATPQQAAVLSVALQILGGP